MAEGKNMSIESLRGAAIILVVIGHVIGSAPDGGMQIAFPHPLRHLYLWIDYIQMPLFTAIAGWAYAIKPLTKSSLIGGFMRKKAIRLLIPMVAIVTLYFLVQYFMPGTNSKGDLSQLWRIYVFPYSIYWYLPALFLILFIQALIDCKNRMTTIKQWAVWLCVALILSQINDVWILRDIPNMFSFKGALGQLPYFFIGVAAYRFAPQLNALKSGWSALLSIIASIVLIELIWFFPLQLESVCRMLCPIVLIPLLIWLLTLKHSSKFLVWIGSYSYSIYLLHGFGTSGGRIVLKMIGIKSMAMIFTFATFVATVCPIVIDRIIARWKWGRVLLGR